MKGITYFPGNQPARKRGTFGGTFCITVGTDMDSVNAETSPSHTFASVFSAKTESRLFEKHCMLTAVTPSKISFCTH